MWSAWFERLKAQLAAVTSAETIEFETARQVACVRERLQNNFLIPTSSGDKPFAPIDQGPVQVRPLGVARRSCGAH